MVEHGKHSDDWPDEEPHRPLLPPEDRLWRHPSELSAAIASGAEEQVLAARRRWLASTPSRAGAGAAGLVGALLATGVVLVGTHMTAWLTPARAVHAAAAQKLEATAITVTATTSPQLGYASLQGEIASAEAAVVEVQVVKARGRATTVNGVLVSPSGYVVVPSSALRSAVSISVLRSDGEQLIATVSGADAATGIAVLHIDGSGLPSLPLATSPIESNSLMLVAWRQNGFNISLTPITSAPSTTRIGSGPALVVSCPRTLDHAPLGTILLDAKGEIGGIVVLNRHHQAIAAPGWVVGRITSYLISDGRVVHGWLGIAGTEARLPEPLLTNAALGHKDAASAAYDRSVLTTAVKVLMVQPKSAAALAGIRRGDLVEAIDGVPVASMGQLQAILYLMAPETTVQLEVIRGTRQSDVSARLDKAA